MSAVTLLEGKSNLDPIKSKSAKSDKVKCNIE